ncbi:MAG: peptide deformylase [Parcubacteria group bacterium]|nr:peptide deformylase [Parcubacteria group bacterium]
MIGFKQVMVREILQKEHKVLHEKAKEIPVSSIRGDDVQSLISDMFETLLDTEKGVALAAPQIGEPVRMFVVSPNIFGEDEKADLVFINPELVNASKESELIDEGCLSVNGKYGLVHRASKVMVTAYDKEGNKFSRGASGLLAQIFQHEIGHLNGELYVDIATEVHDVPTQKEE